MSLIVITCASGKQNARLIPHLYDNPRYRLRLAVNTLSSKEKLLKQYPEAEVVQTDLEDPSAVRQLVQDAAVFYHVGPSFHPHEAEFGFNVVDACVAASKEPESKFKHFIFSSVLCTQLRKLLNHDCKRYVEEYLMESGLNYTILQPTTFMDNISLRMFLAQPVDNTVFPAPWNPAIAFSHLALHDLGEVAAKVIDEGEKHYLATYPLCSTRPMSNNEVMKVIGKVIGRNIRIEKLTFEEAREGLLKRLFGDKEVPWQTKDVAERMLLYYDSHGLVGNPNVLTWLLGRQPMEFEAWAGEQIKLITGETE